jgi:hypothetical protein
MNASTNSKAGIEWPAPQEFFLTVPLYQKFNLIAAEGDPVALYSADYRIASTKVLQIENYAKAIDAYCIECKSQSVFQRNNKKSRLPFSSGVNSDPGIEQIERLKHEARQNVRDRIFHTEFACTRDENHRMYFHFQIHNLAFMKIGQYPSIADLASFDIVKYRNILGNQNYHEFIKAIGLHAHGVGIGAFVYLRRIFEGLIEEAHQIAKQDCNWDEGTYGKSRVADKIALLQNHLPSFLVENKVLYSIMSKGIHDLSEQECLSYFTSIKIAIELILDEKIERAERQKKLDAAKKNISIISGKLG